MPEPASISTRLHFEDIVSGCCVIVLYVANDLLPECLIVEKFFQAGVLFNVVAPGAISILQKQDGLFHLSCINIRRYAGREEVAVRYLLRSYCNRGKRLAGF